MAGVDSQGRGTHVCSQMLGSGKLSPTGSKSPTGKPIFRPVAELVQDEERRLPEPAFQCAAVRGKVVREVTLSRTRREDPLGMTLVKPMLEGDAADAATPPLVASVAPGGLAAQAKGLQPGDLITAVNGVKVVDYKHAAEVLRNAEGTIQLVIETSGGVPDGWEVRTDKSGQTYYKLLGTNVKTYDHPAALEVSGRHSLSPESRRRSSSYDSHGASEAQTSAITSRRRSISDPAASLLQRMWRRRLAGRSLIGDATKGGG
eukprot:92945-Prymnesium_polylepis.1